MVILAWEGAKKFWKKVIVPVCENVVEKAHKEKGSEKDPLEEPPAKKGGKEESAENAGDPEKRSKFIGAKALRARKGK